MHYFVRIACQSKIGSSVCELYTWWKSVLYQASIILILLKFLSSKIETRLFKDITQLLSLQLENVFQLFQYPSSVQGCLQGLSQYIKLTTKKCWLQNDRNNIWSQKLWYEYKFGKILHNILQTKIADNYKIDRYKTVKNYIILKGYNKTHNTPF